MRFLRSLSASVALLLGESSVRVYQVDEATGECLACRKRGLSRIVERRLSVAAYTTGEGAKLMGLRCGLLSHTAHTTDTAWHSIPDMRCRSGR